MTHQTGSGLFSGLTNWLNKKQETQPDPDLLAKAAMSPAVAPNIPPANEADAQKLLLDLNRQVQQVNASRHDPQRLADIKAVLQGVKGGSRQYKKRSKRTVRKTRKQVGRPFRAAASQLSRSDVFSKKSRRTRRMR